MDLLATLKPYLVIGVRLNLTVLLWRLYFISQRGKANLNSHQKSTHTYSFLSKKNVQRQRQGCYFFHYWYNSLLWKQENGCDNSLVLPWSPKIISVSKVEWTSKTIFAQFCIFWICEKFSSSIFAWDFKKVNTLLGIGISHKGHDNR